MDSAITMSRLQFAFTASYHYLFPQFTMGVALLILILKTLAVRRGDEKYHNATRFWTKIFAVSFIIGVVTGIPMEFQFGTNWALFSTFAGNIIAQLLAMEGAFAFFLESAFLGLLLFGERRFGQRVHWFAALMVFIGTWASGFFIIAADAWIQHPVGYTTLPDGGIKISDYWAVVFNSWTLPMYFHTMSGAVITGAFAMTGLGAYYVLLNRHVEYGRLFLKIGVIVGVIATIFQLYPSGDFEGQQVAQHQPTKLAAMEGLYNTSTGAGVVILGQPDTQTQTLDNKIEIPHVLSFLTYRRWTAKVLGLNSFPRTDWPDNIPLLYYSYHIMVGLGTIFIAMMVLAALLLWRQKLWKSRWMLWILLLATPFPFIANTAGWLTTELGRQPWLIYNLLRTNDGVSMTVSSGNVLFTLIGFAGMYLIMGLLYVVLIVQDVAHGPESSEPDDPDAVLSLAD
ncbi:MAG: cytochrome ubiquinol oxidase subunit I [Nitrolancea sp.]